jgi:hypothetical protein
VDLHPFFQPCIGFFPPGKVFRDGRDSNHAVYGHEKKMYIPWWKYTIIRHAMSIRLVEGG